MSTASGSLYLLNPTPYWYVMRVTYGRERKMADMLESRGVSFFLPTKTEHYLSPKDGRLKKREVSVIPNILFVRSTRPCLQQLKQELENFIPMRYMMDRSTRRPMTVPDRQMDDFIRITTEAPDSLMYLDNPSVALEKGTPVEIIYGPFAGIQGYVLRIRRDRKVVLTLNTVLAAAITAEIRPEWIRKLR